MTTQKPTRSPLSRSLQIAQNNTGLLALWCGMSVTTALILGVTNNLITLSIILIAQSVVGFFLQKGLLGGAGHRVDRTSFWAFLALSALMAIMIVGGLFLLIVPGYYLFIRWMVAIPILLSEGASPVESLNRSWQRTQGHAGEIFVATLPFLALLVISSVMGGDKNLGSHVLPAVLGGMGGALLFCYSIACFEAFSASHSRNTADSVS